MTERRIETAPDGARIYPVRASSWGGLFDCAHRFEGVTFMGLKGASGMRAHLGSSVHTSTAVFDLAKTQHNPVSVDDAAGAFIEALHNPAYEVDFRQDDLSIKKAEQIGLTLHTMYCHDISPQFNYSQVEMTLNPLHIDCGGGVVIKLTGSMDRARVADTADGAVIPDLKTGGRVITDGKANTKGRSAQLGVYQLLYEHTTEEPTVGGQIIALSTGSKQEAAVSKVWDARPLMLGSDGTPGLIEYAAQMFRSGSFPPNNQSALCSPRYCTRWNLCKYRDA
jgi:hypothetical protein